jgi:hypothetical protein
MSVADFFHYAGGGGLWAVLTIVGPIILGAAIAWGVFTNRFRTPREREASERGTRQLYEDLDRQEKAGTPNNLEAESAMADKGNKDPRLAEEGSRPESYSGEEPRDTLDQPPPPMVQRADNNRGVAAAPVEGVAVGSGAGAGGGGSPEDYDSDPQAGGGRLPTHNPEGGSGGDAAKHNSR